jgi:hypothetical protein
MIQRELKRLGFTRGRRIGAASNGSVVNAQSPLPMRHVRARHVELQSARL